MTDQALQFPRFYVTAPAPCPYLPGREERKVFTELRGEEATRLNEALGRVGFRRSQSVAYRPACEGCNACISVRVVAPEFRPTRSLRRIAARNADLIGKKRPPIAREEHYRLLKAYLTVRHPEGGMADMEPDDFAEMVESSPVETFLVEYRLPAETDGQRSGRLVAAALTDDLSDGLSMVYSFYDPSLSGRSLGTYMILDHVARAAKAGKRHVYLGYWIANSPKMAYKRSFAPLERLGPEGWRLFESDRGGAPRRETGEAREPK